MSLIEIKEEKFEIRDWMEDEYLVVEEFMEEEKEVAMEDDKARDEVAMKKDQEITRVQCFTTMTTTERRRRCDSKGVYVKN